MLFFSTKIKNILMRKGMVLSPAPHRTLRTEHVWKKELPMPP